jgi:hypothetical protein
VVREQMDDSERRAIAEADAAELAAEAGTDEVSSEEGAAAE